MMIDAARNNFSGNLLAGNGTGAAAGGVQGTQQGSAVQNQSQNAGSTATPSVVVSLSGMKPIEEHTYAPPSPTVAQTGSTGSGDSQAPVARHNPALTPAVLAALAGMKPIVEYARPPQGSTPAASPASTPQAGAALTPAAIAAANGAKPTADLVSTVTHAVSSAVDTVIDKGYVCAGGAYGVAVGVCADTHGTVVVQVGAGTQGVSLGAGLALNGDTASHLAGWSVTAIAPNYTGITYSPGNPGITSVNVGMPGASVTYGFPIESSKPYEFHVAPPMNSNPNQCTKSDYEHTTGFSLGALGDAGDSVGPTAPPVDMSDDRGSGRHKEDDMMAEA
ncbi:hypothetical protein [Chromobacterium subtsugae]|uniref:hypothetical protein n=1 Tax=Chromobacterium subtsugae TaxID=251747 RepID=UPI000B233827|nr:hypothetical protein [Chromobacterium subtsugae]